MSFLKKGVTAVNTDQLIQYLKTRYRQVALAILALTIVTSFVLKNQQNETPMTDNESADTYIPAGYVLVPIEVLNRQALESLLGAYGVVDLFLPSLNPEKPGRKVASRVKILRAPLRPEEFAVLVKESEASQLVQSENGYFVVIQNPAQRGTRLVKPPGRRSRISFEDG